MHPRKRPVCLLLILILTLTLLPVRGEGGGSAPLRVLLRRLGLGERARITLSGTYLLRGENGTELLLQPEQELLLLLRDQRIFLHSEVFSASLGASLTLTRQADGRELPGLRIGSSGLYPGDLSLTVEEGKLTPVLTLDLEDYLRGVVPYEMSDSFPLEALKAQAVCARTYAMNKMDPSLPWDVVDTTNDQVFRGIPGDQARSDRAVAETAGLVLTRSDRLVECWYSASNGGQTEIPAHVWGSADTVGRYEIREDPWDLENPDSLTRSARFRKDGSGLYRRITGLLRAAVQETAEWKAAGLSARENDFRIDAIRAVSLKTPKYEKPSRLMTELEVTLSVSGRRISGGTLHAYESAGAFTVTLPVFPDVLTALGLTINGTGNELLSVTEEEDAFRLTSARFGHGVGLSQRGAQYMASRDGKNFEEILAFYFPDAKLKRYEGETQALPSAPPLLAETPTPAPSAAPKPTLMPVTEENLPEGAWLASVENIADGTTLNLRSDASPVASVLMTLAKHQRLIVLDDMDVPGWARVKTDAVEGYVMTSFLKKVK